MLTGRQSTDNTSPAFPASPSQTGQALAEASSGALHLPHWLNPSTSWCACPTWHVQSGSSLPLLTGRQRMAPPTMNPSRSASHYIKCMQRLAVGISHGSQTGRKAGPTHSPPTETTVQLQQRTRLWGEEGLEFLGTTGCTLHKAIALKMRKHSLSI